MILPTAPSESHLDFNPEYLARGASGNKVSPGISVWAEKPDAQAVVRSSREDFIAIVMPMKGFTESPYPPYVRALIGRRRNSTFVEADDPSLFGELEKPQPEVKIVKASAGNGKAPETQPASVSTLEPLKETVAKKRGRGRSATAGV